LANESGDPGRLKRKYKPRFGQDGPPSKKGRTRFFLKKEATSLLVGFITNFAFFLGLKLNAMART